MSNKIVDVSDLDKVIKKGEDSQKAREVAIERGRKEEEEKKKQEVIKKLTEDAGTTSQQNRGKGI